MYPGVFVSVKKICDGVLVYIPAYFGIVVGFDERGACALHEVVFIVVYIISRVEVVGFEFVVGEFVRASVCVRVGNFYAFGYGARKVSLVVENTVFGRELAEAHAYEARRGSVPTRYHYRFEAYPVALIQLHILIRSLCEGERGGRAGLLIACAKRIFSVVYRGIQRYVPAPSQSNSVFCRFADI